MEQNQLTGWTLKLSKFYSSLLSEKGIDLRPCTIIIRPLKSRLGEWDRSARALTLSEELLSQGSWEDIRHVLLHETAHQIVDEIFCRKDKPHGQLFTEACKLLGISPRASYSLRKGTADSAVRRIKKLMALSESANENEAAAALSKAQELSFRNNIDLINTPGREFSIRPLGKIRRRTPSYEWKLINILMDFYFVKALHIYHEIDSNLHWQFELYGTCENIDSAEYVYNYLNAEAEFLWAAYRKDAGKAVSRKRNVFINGLFEGFRRRLQKEKEELQNRYAVVHVNDPELEQFFYKCNPRISRRKISYRIDQSIYDDGIKDGGQIKVRPGPPERRVSGLLEG